MPPMAATPRRTSVVFLAPEPLLEGETGPNRRTVKLAETTAETCSVTLAAPSPSVFPDGPFRTLETGPVHAQDLRSVVCGNERQRDLVLGAALATGAMAPGAEAERIAVVPYGIDAAPPRPTRAPLRAAGLLADGERLVIWAGGMWSWLDPLTALRALELL